MDIQKDYSCLEKNSVVLSKSIDNENDYQESLPAYCDDIYRVVKCLARSSVSSAEVSYNEVKITGKTVICLTYYNDSSCLCYADFEEEFTKTLNADNLSEGAFASADIYDKYTNFRVINQRRIDIHTASSVKVNVYDMIKCPCIASCSDSKLKTQSVNSASIVKSNISRLEFDESFTIPTDSEPIKRIVSNTALADITETRIIKDKALIKASVKVGILYTADNGREDVLKSEYSFNVSKIIDVAGIAEGDIAISKISVSSLYLKAKASSGDKLNVVDVFGEANISSLFIREAQEDLIVDGYAVKRDSECSFSDYGCMKDGNYISDSRLINKSVELSDSIKEIKELDVKLTTANVRNAKIYMGAAVNALYINENNDLNSQSVTSEIELEINDCYDAVASVSLQSVDYTLNDSGRIDLRLNVQINAFTYNFESIKVLSDIVFGDEEKEYPMLSVYFGKADESIWSIAKRFSSDEELIRRENALSGNTLSNNSVLIIPKV